MKKIVYVFLLAATLGISLASHSYEAFQGPTELIQYDPAKAFNGYTLFSPFRGKNSYLIDMHGNVAEWVLDQHEENSYSSFKGKTISDPLRIPLRLFPRVVRGGSWDDDPELLRSAARVGSNEDWKIQDPQEPQSIWYHTDALHVGFRIVRPLVPPSDAEKAAKWDKTEPLQIDLEK